LAVNQASKSLKGFLLMALAQGAPKIVMTSLIVMTWPAQVCFTNTEMFN
jgi:hypothetical protein